jgi:predicted heme/steroid binding protein
MNLRVHDLLLASIVASGTAYAETPGQDRVLAAAQSAAMHDLAMQTTMPVVGGNGMRVCGPLPTDPKLLNALKYAGDTTMVPVSGLSHGLTGLPAGMLRSAYCIAQRPSGKGPNEIKALDGWYFEWFKVRRYDGKQPIIAPHMDAPIWFGGSGTPKSIARPTGVDNSVTVTVPKKSSSRSTYASPDQFAALGPWGGAASAQTSGPSGEVLITDAQTEFVIPNFTIPKEQQTSGGLCNAIWLDQGAVWAGIGGFNTDSGNLLQTGVVFKDGCSGLDSAPVPGLFFFGEYYPTEPAVPLSFPIQIQTTDQVIVGAYWAPCAGSVLPCMLMYNAIDYTKQVGMQYLDPNNGSALVADSAEAVAEPGGVGAGAYSAFPLLATNPLVLTNTTLGPIVNGFFTNVTSSTAFEIGRSVTIKDGKDKIVFSGSDLDSNLTDNDDGVSNFFGTYKSTGVINLKQKPAPE